MPKKKNKETPKQQSERFEKTVREMIDAGELSPTDDPLERVMKGVVRLRRDWFEGEGQECPSSTPAPQGD